jgi:hypothetical protein
VSLTGPAHDYFEVYIHEYEGLAAPSPFDVSASAGGNATGTADDMQSGYATTTASAELIFGLAVVFGSGGVVHGLGFTPRTTVDGDITEDRIIVGAPGRYQATATTTSGTQTWTMIMATFRDR